jgi:integrase
MTDSLTDTKIRALKPRKGALKAFDGGGLYLLVTPDGRRYWRLKYRLAGREKLISCGVYPAVSLKAARRKREKARALLDEGKDPSTERKAERAAQRSAAENTFKTVAEEWFAKKSRRWAKSNAGVIEGRLKKDAYPWLAERPIAAITRDDLLTLLRRVEDRGAIESAHRVRQYIDAVFRYAIDTGRLAANPTPRPEALASPKKGRFASITEPKRVGALVRAICGYQGTFVTQCALKLAPLVFVRPGELRTADWREFDLDAAEWRIPDEKTKMRSPHLVPLSTQAVAILRELHPLTGSGKWVFPSERGHGRPMSANTLNAALRALGFSKEQMTAHGFRHTASTLLNESSKWHADAIERQLAHVDRDDVRAAYNRAEHLPERKRMMQWWADYLDELATSKDEKVVSIRARAS